VIDLRWLREVMPLILMTKDFLQSRWRKAFAARNILVLGSKQTGKSSLTQFLHSGTPFEISGGDIKAPAPTAMAAIVDYKFSPNKTEWLRLRRDVPGDLDLRATWKQAITDIRPHGIIFMIDGRQDADTLARDVSEIRQDVLAHYLDGTGHLATIHVFLGFCDQWAADPIVARRRCRSVEDALLQVIEATPALSHLRVHVSETQLSPARKSWAEVERALARFAADLVD
jgi:Signal recognition particle receptor beta subunit